MAEAETQATQVEAAAPEKTVAESVGKANEVVTTVWVPSGPVAKNQLLRTAIESVRDAIPVVFDLDAEITSSRKAQNDKRDGREYTITVTYTPRGDGKQDPVDVDKVVKGLEAPSFDAFHPGDPDFLGKQD